MARESKHLYYVIIPRKVETWLLAVPWSLNSLNKELQCQAYNGKPYR